MASPPIGAAGIQQAKGVGFRPSLFLMRVTCVSGREESDRPLSRCRWRGAGEPDFLVIQTGKSTMAWVGFRPEGVGPICSIRVLGGGELTTDYKAAGRQ